MEGLNICFQKTNKVLTKEVILDWFLAVACLKRQKRGHLWKKTHIEGYRDVFRYSVLRAYEDSVAGTEKKK